MKQPKRNEKLDTHFQPEALPPTSALGADRLTSINETESQDIPPVGHLSSMADEGGVHSPLCDIAIT